MPATITHSLFSEDLFNRINTETKKRVESEKKAFIMFSQSTDPLMFYNIMSPKRGKRIRDLQYTFHADKTSIFFDNTIKYIKQNNYYKDPLVLAFLYGFISHYYLDSNVHPFVFYKTGIFNKKDKTTHKYNGLHHFMETYIDNYMLEKKGKTNYNIAKDCFDIKPFSKSLKDVMNYSFNKRYSISDFDKEYYKSLKDMRLFIKLFRLDKYGIKKKIYRLIDKITPKSCFVFEALSYKNSNNKYDYLNDNHHSWKNPWNSKAISSKSFDDLYSDSLKDATTALNSINDYFFKDKKLDIKELFQKTNQLGGEEKKKPLFFEF